MDCDDKLLIEAFSVHETGKGDTKNSLFPLVGLALLAF